MSPSGSVQAGQDLKPRACEHRPEDNPKTALLLPIKDGCALGGTYPASSSFLFAAPAGCVLAQGVGDYPEFANGNGGKLVQPTLDFLLFWHRRRWSLDSYSELPCWSLRDFRHHIGKLFFDCLKTN